MIVKTYDFMDFVEEFEAYDRGNCFSDEALEELFNYYDDLGMNFEMDAIGICCDWTEYSDLDDYANDYMKESDFEEFEESEYIDAIWSHIKKNAPYYFKLSNGGVLFMNY